MTMTGRYNGQVMWSTVIVCSFFPWKFDKIKSPCYSLEIHYCSRNRFVAYLFPNFASNKLATEYAKYIEKLLSPYDCVSIQIVMTFKWYLSIKYYLNVIITLIFICFWYRTFAISRVPAIITNSCNEQTTTRTVLIVTVRWYHCSTFRIRINM